MSRSIDVSCGAACAGAETLDISCALNADALVRYAVSELQRLAQAVWAPVSGGAKNSGRGGTRRLPTMYVGSVHEDPRLRGVLQEAGEPTLGTQAYVIRRGVDRDRATLWLAGGSPAAALWAVYELAEFWGVRFLPWRDVIPGAKPLRAVEPAPIRREPAFALRAWRGFNVLPHSVAYWSVDDCQQMIDQLAKLRFNAYYMFLRPFDPFVDFVWAGQNKESASISFGERYPVRPTWVGREKFGDAQWFENPSIPSHGSYPCRIGAARDYVKSLRDHARARGIQFGAMFWFNEFAPEFKRRLRDLSVESGFQPQGESSGHAGRLGNWREGVNPKVSPYMSIRNEHYVELAETQLLGVLDAFRDADFCVIGHSEFTASTADFDHAWASLIERHPRLSSWSMETLLGEAVEQTRDDFDVIDPARIANQIKSQVCMLYVLDEILHRRDCVDLKKVGPKLIFSGADAILPLAAHILGPDIELLSALGGYLASDAARHADWLKQTARTGRPLHVQLSLEDDNIGLTPQLTGSSLHTVIRAALDAGCVGVWGRQWLHSKLSPTIDLLSHLYWDADLSPAVRYRQLIEPICGDWAVEPMNQALLLGKRLTDHHDHCGASHSFLVPNLLGSRWDGAIQPKIEMLEAIPLYERYIAQLLVARELSRPEGRAWIDDMLHQAYFCVNWMTVQDNTYRAGEAYRHALVCEASSDPNGVDDAMRTSVTLINAAISASSQALTHWAAGVRDRSDLGALAALNHYGHEFLLAQRHLVGLKAGFWTCQVHGSAQAKSGEFLSSQDNHG